MRIVDISSFFSDGCGGIKSYYRAKARLLPQRGYDCHFIVPGSDNRSEPFGGGTLHRIAGPLMPGSAHYRFFGDGDALTSLVSRLQPEVVELASHYFLPGLMGRLTESMPKTALVGFYHSDIPNTLVAPAASLLPSAWGRAAMETSWQFVRSVHGRYRGTLVASRMLAERLKAQGVPRVHWVGLGVDCDVFKPEAATLEDQDSKKPLQLAYAGRLSSDKGINHLLEAFDEIHRATGAHLDIVGDGPQRGRVLRFADKREGVHYLGYRDQPEAVSRILAAADVAITPGAFETFSLATAEALACGTPVVAPAQGGAGELVHDAQAGACFAVGGDKPGRALAASAIQLLRLPPGDLRDLGMRGRRHILSNFTWSKIMDRICAIYEQVGQETRGHRNYNLRPAAEPFVPMV